MINKNYILIFITLLLRDQNNKYDNKFIYNIELLYYIYYNRPVH